MKKSTKVAAIILGGLTIVVLVLLVITQPQGPEKSGPDASPIPGQELGQIPPGTASQEDVFAKLGQPLTTQETDGSTVLSYPSYNQYNPNQVIVADDKVIFIREKLYEAPSTSLGSHLSALGQNYVELYGPDVDSGVILYAYPEIGRAILGNPYNDTAYESWYFPQGTLAQTLNLPEFADYSTEETSHQDL